MGPKDIVDAVFRLLEILTSWPVILLVIILLVHRELPGIISSLAQRITKAPGGFEFAELKEEVKTLTDKVKQIEEKITFESSTALTPYLEQELNSALFSFRSYLQELGFELKEGQVSVRIESESEAAPSPDVASYSYYDYSCHRIVISEDLAYDNDFALREYTNHALSSVIKVGAEISTTYEEIKSGLAFYLPCSFNNRTLFAPVFAKKSSERPYRWDLNNDKKFTKIRSSYRISSDLQGEIWGAAFWEMRTLLGQKPADKLLFSTWSVLQSPDLHSNKRIDFARRLLESVPTDESGNHVQQIRDIFERRGLKI